jgi:hypothetical protein
MPTNQRFEKGFFINKHKTKEFSMKTKTIGIIALAVIFGLSLTACTRSGGGGGGSAGGGRPNAESDFTVTLTSDNAGVIITRYTGTSARVVIPATIQGLPVVEIGNNAFRENENITSVVIPEGIVIIRNNAFYECRRLASVTLPSTLVRIESSAFRACKALTSISLPAGLQVLGNDVFMHSGLTSFPNPWPAEITVIPDFTFTGTNLGDIVIPEGIIQIRNRAFEDIGLTSVTLPSSIRSIHGNAFSGNPNLSLASQAAIRQAGYTGPF